FRLDKRHRICHAPFNTLVVLYPVVLIALLYRPLNNTAVAVSYQPFQNRSPVLETNYLEFDWFLPKTGLQFVLTALKRIFALLYFPLSLRRLFLITRKCNCPVL
ncbi:MAG: hypothetical protein ABJR07_08735, partial [Lentilitoribacter sp.]